MKIMRIEAHRYNETVKLTSGNRSITVCHYAFMRLVRGLIPCVSYTFEVVEQWKSPGPGWQPVYFMLPEARMLLVGVFGGAVTWPGVEEIDRLAATRVGLPVYEALTIRRAEFTHVSRVVELFGDFDEYEWFVVWWRLAQ